MSQPFGVKIVGDSWFHDGWVRGVLGLPKPEFFSVDDPVLDIDIDAFDDGYEMGLETPNELRRVMGLMLSRNQLRVQ